MLHTARVAGSANRLAPVQERRSVGTALVRGLFAPAMVWWLHPHGCQLATGSTVPAVQDFSGCGVTITQGTASKQPLRGGVQGVPCLTFDGVNDSMSTSATDLTDTTALTVCIAEYRNNTAGTLQLELTTDATNVFTNGYALVANDGSVNGWEAIFKGNAGYQIKNVASATTPSQSWRAWVSVGDKSQAAANELKVFSRGATVTSFQINTTSENSNAFANASWYLGARNNTLGFFNGSIAQALVLRGAVSDTRAQLLSSYLAQSAGIA